MLEMTATVTDPDGKVIDSCKCQAVKNKDGTWKIINLKLKFGFNLGLQLKFEPLEPK